VNVSSLSAKSLSERAWHAAHGVSTSCAIAVKQYAFLICRRLAVQVLMEVKSGHADGMRSVSYPTKLFYFGCHKPQIGR
jgi:hypothetical protein